MFIYVNKLNNPIYLLKGEMFSSLEALHHHLKEVHDFSDKLAEKYIANKLSKPLYFNKKEAIAYVKRFTNLSNKKITDYLSGKIASIN